MLLRSATTTGYMLSNKASYNKHKVVSEKANSLSFFRSGCMGF